MRIKKTYIIPVLFLLISCNKEQKKIDTWDNRIAESKTGLNSKKKKGVFESQKVVADTITNWQFYKDSELLFKSNILDSNRFTAEIKKSDKYEHLILKLFYDFNNQEIKRRIQLVSDEKTIATFVDENRSRFPFRIEKFILDRMRIDYSEKEIKIIYSDPILKNGITVGILKLTNK